MCNAVICVRFKWASFEYQCTTLLNNYMVSCRNVAGGTFSKITVDSHITLKEILNRTISKRKDMVKIKGKSTIFWCHGLFRIR